MNTVFEDYIMICNSTGVQTVNLLPVLQFGSKKVVIISTPFTEAQGLTARLVDVLNKKGIESEILKITVEEEKNFKSLSSKLINYTENLPKVVWNVSGGQKIPSATMLYVFQKRIEEKFKNDIALYVEANPPEIWYFDASNSRYWLRTSAPLSLDELLYLFNYETLKDEERLYPDPSREVRNKIEIGRKALKYFKENDIFREAFFNYMKAPEPSLKTKDELKEYIRKSLNELKPELHEVHVTKQGYEDLERKIKIIFSSLHQVKTPKDLYQLIEPLNLILKPKEIYEDYWNSIKRAVIDKVIKRIEFDEIKLVSKKLNDKEKNILISQIRDLGGQIDIHDGPLYKNDVKAFSAFRSNGILFEWMVAASIIDEIMANPKLRNFISEVYHGVKTKRLNSSHKHDAEHDIVIVTSFGTLIIIELKTYEFSGDLAQAQEALAYKKSGPYGQAIIIGPLLTSMVRVDQNGIKEFPHYINGPLVSQEDTARQNNIKYYYLDQIPKMLKEKLFIQEE
ncbi:MAG: hypothetical protein N2257_09855 [Thermodesulfovibrionales bacterium]|nr:hypothetical protein [Thermodesulfovibrionales bacterium]